MKRSQINQIMRESDRFMREHGFYLPPFAYFQPGDWTRLGPEAKEISANALGWDITDFGSGRFDEVGLFMFTVRNGHPNNWTAKSGKLYCEKIMIVGVGQVTPMHFHWNKMEDIINRGGGNLVIELYSSTKDEKLSDQPLKVKIDGITRTVMPGGKVVLTPGESICLEPYIYHRFYGEQGKGLVLVGEVSSVNDDTCDNRFLEPQGRFPAIDENEAPVHLLATDYKKYI